MQNEEQIFWFGKINPPGSRSKYVKLISIQVWRLLLYFPELWLKHTLVVPSTWREEHNAISTTAVKSLKFNKSWAITFKMFRFFAENVNNVFTVLYKNKN